MTPLGAWLDRISGKLASDPGPSPEERERERALQALAGDGPCEHWVWPHERMCDLGCHGYCEDEGDGPWELSWWNPAYCPHRTDWYGCPECAP